MLIIGLAQYKHSLFCCHNPGSFVSIQATQHPKFDLDKKSFPRLKKLYSLDLILVLPNISKN